MLPFHEQKFFLYGRQIKLKISIVRHFPNFVFFCSSLSAFVLRSHFLVVFFTSFFRVSYPYVLLSPLSHVFPPSFRQSFSLLLSALVGLGLPFSFLRIMLSSSLYLCISFFMVCLREMKTYGHSRFARILVYVSSCETLKLSFRHSYQYPDWESYCAVF